LKRGGEREGEKEGVREGAETERWKQRDSLRNRVKHTEFIAPESRCQPWEDRACITHESSMNEG
jgi:hypothetical protein